MIIVPCWWDETAERYSFYTGHFSFATLFNSLTATLKTIRPDLLPNAPNSGSAIPEVAPPNYFDKHVPQVEDLGEPMTAGFLTKSNVDPSGW